MVNTKTEVELKRILEKFNVPELILTEKKDAGPDEELYLFEDKNGEEYGLWARDYMSELKYEANGLKNDFGIEVGTWLKTSTGEETLELGGDTYALFKV